MSTILPSVLEDLDLNFDPSVSLSDNETIPLFSPTPTASACSESEPPRKSVFRASPPVQREEKRLREPYWVTNVQGFELVEKAVVKETQVAVAEYVDEATGLRVGFVDQFSGEGPLQRAYITILTPVKDDSGAVAALRKMLLVASSNGPEYLKCLARRLGCEVNVDKAMSDEWRTTFVLFSTTPTSLLTVLPTFISQLFSPAFRQSDFASQVCSMDSKGNGSGALLREVTLLGTSGDWVRESRIVKSLWSPGDPGSCKAEGTVASMQTLKLSSIKKLPNTLFVPQNMMITIISSAKVKSVLKAIRTALPSKSNGGNGSTNVREQIIAKMPNPVQLKAGKEDVCDVPGVDDTVAQVSMTWMGPSSSSTFEVEVIKCLWAYFGNRQTGEIAPWMNGQGLSACADFQITHSRSPNLSSTLSFSAVPNHLVSIHPIKVVLLLHQLATKEFDLDRLERVVELQRLDFFDRVEKDVDALVDEMVLGWMFTVESDTDSSLSKLDHHRLYERIKNLSGAEWKGYFTKFVLENSPVTLLSYNNADLLETAQKIHVGACKVLPPLVGSTTVKALEGIQQLTPPAFQAIKWAFAETAGCGGAKKGDGDLQDLIDQEGVEPHIQMQFNQPNSCFLIISVLLSTANLPPSLLPLLPTYVDTFFLLPNETRSSGIVPVEEMNKMLFDSTVGHSITAHYSGELSMEAIAVELRIEPGHYEEAVDLLDMLLYGSQFDANVLEKSLERQAQRLTSQEEDRQEILISGWQEMVYSSESATKTQSLWELVTKTESLTEALKKDPEQFMDDMDRLRESLTDGRRIRVEVRGDILHLPNPVKTWIPRFRPPHVANMDPTTATVLEAQPHSTLALKPRNFATIHVVDAPTTQSAFIGAVGSPNDDDSSFPALTVACELLSVQFDALNSLRVQGIGINFTNDQLTECSGLVRLTITAAPRIVDVVGAVQSVLCDIAEGKLQITDEMIQGAWSILALCTAKSMRSEREGGKESFINQSHRNRPAHFGKNHICECSKVSKIDVLGAVKSLIFPLTNPSKSFVSAVCTDGEQAALKASLARRGYKVSSVQLK
ncbi:hypothetical protein T439DRAFT_708 [Meredithblackwellia eburnea MCA 4105]